MNSANTPYPSVTSKPDLPRIEERILAYWKQERIFEQSVESRPAGKGGENEFVFYDGPPFANGLPHYGHLLTGYVKDVVPRYQTMRGRRVERRFGWDCHGLPAEMEAEKQLGIHGQLAILDYGIEKFNAVCRESVQKYTQEWETTVTRQARWVDFQNDYRTLDLSYMESVLWAFKQLHEKGLIYEGTRVLPYAWAAETPVSNFETRMDNAYRERQDPALTVAITLDPRPGDPGPMQLLVWTTTPWTLPSNLAVAVGPEINYTIFKEGDRHFLLAGTVRAKYEKQLKDAEEVGSLRGSELVGRTYRPLFPFFEETKNAFRVLAGDFVNTEEGTGIVHMAPGFGEDDHLLCQQHDIPVVCPVDHKGCFTNAVPPYAGLLVFDANKAVARDLKQQGVVIQQETYLHNYPHCWRTDEPLIYKALGSWFVRVSDFSQRMVELNQQINWIPEHVKEGSFGKWLEGARDWSISRNRFFGTPIPVWKSDDPDHPRTDVYGSVAELERDFGVRVDDLHRPFIDQLTRKNPDDPSGKSTMRRIPDVLDCWFESGSMPYAQVHYPFENREWFESHFPADFIVEYIAQTRGWFYTLMVLSTALFDRPPFRNVICHGVVLDEDQQKLSKRKQNYPSPDEVFSKQGADALRWHLISSPILRGNNLSIDRQGRVFQDVVRHAILPFWNAYAFFTLYANADGIQASPRADSLQLLDRYILGKTRAMVERLTEQMDRYDLPAACQTITGFTDALNNWYIRRSRERFWKHAHDQDKHDAYDTLYTVLTTVVRATAPFLPLITEEIYRGLTGDQSVHLSDWPDVSAFPEEQELIADMDLTRSVCSAALALRKAHNLRTRLPLAGLTVAGEGADRLLPYFDLIRDEVNVKQVQVSDRVEDLGSFLLKVNARPADAKGDGGFQTRELDPAFERPGRRGRSTLGGARDRVAAPAEGGRRCSTAAGQPADRGSRPAADRGTATGRHCPGSGAVGAASPQAGRPTDLGPCATGAGRPRGGPHGTGSPPRFHPGTNAGRRVEFRHTGRRSNHRSRVGRPAGAHLDREDLNAATAVRPGRTQARPTPGRPAPVRRPPPPARRPTARRRDHPGPSGAASASRTCPSAERSAPPSPESCRVRCRRRFRRPAQAPTHPAGSAAHDRPDPPPCRPADRDDWCADRSGSRWPPNAPRRPVHR